MVLIAMFIMRSVNPIENVKKAIGAHEKDIVARQVFYFPVTLQHNELRQNGNGFQINGECPQEFNDGKSTVPVLGPQSNEMRQESNDRTSERSVYRQQWRRSVSVGFVPCAFFATRSRNNKTMMLKTCDMSPARRKMFIDMIVV
eukprot:scaffold3882_cov164-Amphora_coffeaeformis.AAC.14